jgi:translation elongation factor EF-Tu-like GTPase
MAGFVEVAIELLPPEKGGRRTPICLSSKSSTHYRPHLVVHNGDGEMLGVEFVNGPDEPVQPGDTVFATVQLMYEPRVCYDGLVEGAWFDIREGPYTIGIGRVIRRLAPK